MRKEIIANQLANLVVNRAGITFVSRFSDEFNLPLGEILKAWWIAYNLLDGQRLYTQIESLDNQIAADVQLKLFIGVEKAVERLCRWILRYVKDVNHASNIITQFKDHVAALQQHIDNLINSEEYPDVRDEEALYISSGVPTALASLISRLGYLPVIMDIVLLAAENALDYEVVARNYFVAGRVLQIDWLRKNVSLLSRDNKWQALARSALMADVFKLYRGTMLLAINGHKADSDLTLCWIAANHDKVDKIKTMLDELQSYKTLDLAMLSAAIREFGNILGN